MNVEERPAEKVRKLRSALRDLVSLQNGPPLIRDEAEFDEVMARADALLADADAGLLKRVFDGDNHD